MYRFIVFAALLTSGLTALAAPVCDTLVITGPIDSAPHSWLNGNQLDGAAVLLAQRIAKNVGVSKVVLKHYPTWIDTINAVNDGQADLIVAATFTYERERYWNYVRPEYTEVAAVIVTKRNKQFALLRLEDLSNKRGAKLLGQSFGSGRFNQFLETKVELTAVNSYAELINGIANDQFDYGVAYKLGVDNYLMVEGLLKDYSFLATYPYFSEMHFAFSKKARCGPDLLVKFENELKKVLAQKSFQTIVQEYENSYFQLQSTKTLPSARQKFQN